MIDFVGKRKWFYLFSFLVILPGIISMLAPDGLRGGIEFSSGTTFSARFERDVSVSEMRAALTELGHPDSRVQRTSEGRLLVRTDLLEGAAQQPAIGPAPPSERESIETALEERFGPLVDNEGNEVNRFLEFSSVSPSISADIGRDAAIAVLAASIAILVYVTISFMTVPTPLRYGAGAIIALGHDVLVVMGATSIIGRFTEFEVDTLFITAMLTIVGFSVHDTIVVFDRVRENVLRMAGAEVPLEQAVNSSLNQTLSRSLNTSITLLLVIVALILMGGDTIRDFLIVMLIGLVSGTYSSIFVASQFLVSWERGDIPLVGRANAESELA